MKNLFKDIFEYHHHFNQLLLNAIELHAAEIPKRTYPLVCHVLYASGVWNARILQMPVPLLQPSNSFDQSRRIDDLNLQAVLHILDVVNLEEPLTYSNSAGESFTNTARDMLFHAANHATHHKGQVISDFRASGIEPLVTDYIFYRRK